jgi:H+/Cl- antiporter ClcA
MTFVLLVILAYFLPSIIGHNKRHAAGIFLLNFFLGWTFIGWIVALLWACTSDVPAPVPVPVVVVAGGAGNYCSRCGNIRFPSARFCSICGSPS